MVPLAGLSLAKIVVENGNKGEKLATNARRGPNLIRMTRLVIATLRELSQSQLRLGIQRSHATCCAIDLAR